MFIFKSVLGRNVSARPVRWIGVTLAAFGTATISTVPSAMAHEFKVGDIQIEQPWSRATPPGAKTGAGYLSLANKGLSADRLVSVSSPVAPRVEVHQMSVEGGIMKMKPVDGGIEISAGGSVELAPGGYHLMLMGLTKPLVQGETVPVTLTFEKAGALEVRLQVESMGAKTPSHDGGAMSAHGDAK